MNTIIESIRKKHNLSIDFSMAIEGAAMKFILERQKIMTESKAVKTRLKNIDKMIYRIKREYKLAVKVSHSIDNTVHLQWELLCELQKNNQNLLDIDNREPLFTQLKKDICKIFTDNGIQYTNTFGNYGILDEYTLLKEIRIQGGMPDVDFDPRIDH